MAALAVPDRVRAAVSLVDPRSGQRILEAGGGPGASAELICPLLGDGTLVYADRSATAIERTRRRCAEHVDVGRLVLQRCALADVEVTAGSLDTAFTLNVNLFWTGDASRELAVVLTALRPGGRLFVLYDAAGSTTATRILDPVADALRTAGFSAVKTVDRKHLSGVSACRRK